MKHLSFIGYFLCLSHLVYAQIQWNDWNDESFHRAKQEQKLILVDIGMEGCTACRWQDEITYRDPEVVQIIQQHFYAIQVDCQARPDIGEMYSDWSWPATIIMNSDGEQVLGIAGNRRPSSFMEILKDIHAKDQQGNLQVDPDMPYSYPKEPINADISSMRDFVRNQLDNFYDHESGGWGKRLKNNQRSGTFEQLMVRLRAENDSSHYRQLIQTLDGMLQQIDPAWGGIFVASVGDWSSIVPEKRIATQATALTGFAYGYQLTKNPSYLQAIKEIDRYIVKFLTAPSGLFYTSQEDDAPNLPDSVSAREYYAMNGLERRRFGIPPVDHAVYTDLNARLISAYAKVYECTGEKLYFTKAYHASKTLLNQAQTSAGWMRQFVEADTNYAGDKRIRPINSTETCFLSPQAFAGKAMLDMYKISQHKEFLDAAVRIERSMDSLLMDKKLGGYFAIDYSKSVKSFENRKPIEFNAMAGLFTYQLSAYTQDSMLTEKSVKTLLSVYDSSNIKREGPIVGFTSYALEMMVAGYVEYAIVVKDENEYYADEMLQQVIRQFEPAKIVQFSSPDRYPYAKRPTLYICNQNSCSSPIVLLNDISEKSTAFIKANISPSN